MTALVEGFEQGTDGAALTPSDCVFGAFNSSGSKTYTTQHAREALAALFTSTTAGAQSVGYITETQLGGPQAKIGLTEYPTVPSLPPADARLVSFASAGKTYFGLALDTTTGKLSIRKVSDGTDAAVSTAAVVVGETFRYDLSLDCGTGANDGSITVRLFLGANVDGTTPDETLSATGLALPATINSVIVGISFGNPHAWSRYCDDFALNTAGDFPGPQVHGGGGGSGGGTDTPPPVVDSGSSNWELVARWDGSAGQQSLSHFNIYQGYKHASQGPTAKSNVSLVDDPDRPGKKFLRMRMARFKGWLKTTANGGDGTGDAWYGSRLGWADTGTGSVDATGHMLVIRARVSAAALVKTALMWWINQKWPPEIDISEIYQTARQASVTSVHKRNAGTDQTPHPQAQQSVSADFTRWHVFRCEWIGNGDANDRLSFYLDDVLFFNIGAGGKAPGQKNSYDASFVPKVPLTARTEIALAYTGSSNLRDGNRTACQQDISLLELYKLSGTSDTTPPTDPSPVTGATLGVQQSITWSWPQSTDDGSGFAFYQVQHRFADTAVDPNWYDLATQTTETSITVSGLWDATGYVARVRAVDRKGNATAWFESAAVTTEPAASGAPDPVPLVSGLDTEGKLHGQTGQLLAVDGSGTTDATGGVWDWADGTSDDWTPTTDSATVDEPAPGPIGYHRWTNPGDYPCQLVVTNDDGVAVAYPFVVSITGTPNDGGGGTVTPPVDDIPLITMTGTVRGLIEGLPLDGYAVVTPMAWRESSKYDLVLAPKPKQVKVTGGVLEPVKMYGSDDPNLAPTGLGRPDTGYRVEFHVDGVDRAPIEVWPSVSIRGLRFDIADVQDDGTLPVVDPSIVPPAAPQVVAAQVDDSGTVSVSWDASTDDGGAQIDNYRVTVSPGGGTVTTGDGVTLFADVPGLDPGDYTFTVAAHNAAGWGVESDPTSAVTVV